MSTPCIARVSPTPTGNQDNPTGQRNTFEIEEGGQQSNRARMPVSEAKGKQLRALLIVVVMIVGVAMIPNSFSDVEYYEMAFMKTKSSGKVDRSKVYFAGRYFTGIDKTFKKFPMNAQFINLNVTIFNADKIEVKLQGALQYFLNKDELQKLHDAYDLSYRPIIENTALEAIKSTAPSFTVEQYRAQRQMVSKELFTAAKVALGGICCPKDCTSYPCEPGCKPYSTCTDADKGVFCVGKYFQLEYITITKEQEQRFLTKVLEQEKLDTESFKQQEQIERKKTEQEKQMIVNQVTEVSNNAENEAVKIKQLAEASAKATREEARNSGLQIIYSTLNITNSTHKRSLDYFRTLSNHKGVHLYVGYQTMIAKEGN